MQSRRDEIQRKRDKLAELKARRDLRTSPAGRIGIAGSGDIIAPTPGRDHRQDIDTLIKSLVGESRPVSTSTGVGSPAPRGSRPNSVFSEGQLSGEHSEYTSGANGQITPSQPQELRTGTIQTLIDIPPEVVKEVVVYSKGIQTDDLPPPPSRRSRAISELPEDYDIPGTTSTPNKRLSRREQDREEEIRQKLRKEIEEELKATQELLNNGFIPANSVATSNFPARALTDEELNAVTASDEFVDFVERSTKVIERALNEEYDILTDYTMGAQNEEDVEDQGGNSAGRGRRRVKEVLQFYDDRWSKKRMVSSIDFSGKFPELLLASYTKNPAAPHDPDGIVQVWNSHLRDRPEQIFHAQSDILTAKFDPFRPNIIIGGTYSGQVLLWDSRARTAAPVQKTPLTGAGHTHPIYSFDVVGSTHANNIISVSTDGTFCVWSVDMMSQPSESLTLTHPNPGKNDDVAPTSIVFQEGDPTYFVVGTEEGTIYPCHRYDRAGAKAGIDTRVAYKGHAGPVMSVHFHPTHSGFAGGDLLLSSSLDWSVKLWKTRPPAATSSVVEQSQSTAGIAPLLDLSREDVVYDAAWSPTRPGVFALVDGAGSLELWDLSVETEIPVTRITPTERKDGRQMLSKSLNKVTWERHEGKRLATGGIDGTVSLFEVGDDLGGKAGLRSDEWASVDKLIKRLEAQNNGVL